MKSRISNWILQNRANTRMAFYLQMITRVAGALLGLVWTRLLLGAMGNALYGQFIAFQGVATLGGLGDLGIGGALGIPVSRYLGSGDEDSLRKFLAVARWLFILLACSIPAVLFALSGYLPGWLGFHPVPGSGNLTTLFQVGAFNVLLLIAASYVNNLNYSAVNLTWTIIPAFVTAQLAIVLHIACARMGAPLWGQYGAYVILASLSIVVAWRILAVSNRDLGRIFPIRFDRAVVASLAKGSFWAYLASVGTALYYTYDRLVINANLGASAIPAYQVNYKLCELLGYIFVAAGAAGAPKLGLWIASQDSNLRRRASVEAQRLNALQVFCGVGAAYFYLLINDLFVKLWVGGELNVTLGLQIAFATSMVVGAGFDAAAGLAGRVDERGLRALGTTIAVGGVINAVLTFIAARNGSIVGIAAATIVAQTFQTSRLGAFVSRRLGINPWSWWRRSFVFPMIFVSIGSILRSCLPATSPVSVVLLVIADSLLLAGFAKVVGLRFADFSDELRILSKMFKI